ncbi:MAG: hypothetical protein OSA81_01735 [Longimicrobiales bacterium]|nr:hypothetical protein [Longimicrobiales bacterium]
MRSEAKAALEYLDELLSEGRATIVIHLSEGFEGTMNWGIVSGQVPLWLCICQLSPLMTTLENIRPRSTA